ncbi:MAG: DNA translocase FtsK [Verrucomicrobiota bacterium]
MALISYDASQGLAWRGGESSEGNWLGWIGVAFGWGAFSLWGAAAYLLPGVSFWLGWRVWKGREVADWKWWFGVLILISSTSCLVDFLHAMRGGWVGGIIGRGWIFGMMGQTGGWFLVSFLYGLGWLGLMGMRPWEPPVGVRKAGVKPGEEALSEEPRFVRDMVIEDLSFPRKFEPAGAEDFAQVDGECEEEDRWADTSAEEEGEAVERETFPKEEKAVFRQPAAPCRGSRLPSVQLLRTSEHSEEGAEEIAEQKAMMRTIVETLESFRVRVAPGEVTRGPTVTRYELIPEQGLSVRKITALEADLALATKAKRISILAPIPGKGSVGIEIANRRRSMVGLRELMQTAPFADGRYRLPLALGKDVYGDPLVADLAKMPHLLVAGATGSGKSVCLNTIIASLLFRFSPEELKMIMVDPKVVEMRVYQGLPHLALPVVSEAKEVLQALRWCLNEMERRYRLFAENSVRNLADYNELIDEGLPSGEEEQADFFQEAEGASGPSSAEKLPYLVIIIDELADLMQVASDQVESAICRLCQKARAAGIHVIVATQSPRTDVITGLIKANISARIAFQVASGTDSRIIMDKTGADKLVGQGDMLFVPPDSPIQQRAQGAFLSDEEVALVVDHWRVDGEEPNYVAELAAAEEDEGTELSEADEEIFGRVLELVLAENKASASFLQRRLKIGYTRAARLMDILESRGIVGPAEGSKPRQILVAQEAQAS